MSHAVGWGVKTHAWILAAAWTLALAVSLTWNWRREFDEARLAASEAARAEFTKDVIYRRWNAARGGVYVPITESSPPNPYLTQVQEREIETTTGRRLTLINPAYMTRQVHELGFHSEGVRGHITSLDPIRPANAPDAWERRALESFEQGEQEAASVQTMDGDVYLRLMRPLITEESCLKCHALQGYKEGEVRGGISVSMPMEPYLAIARGDVAALGFVHGVLWLLGLVGIVLAKRGLQRRERERDLAEAERDKTIAALQDALEDIKTLRGIVPICAHCKKIRDDKGYWNQVEIYVHEHSEAEFSHSICPDCLRELYESLPNEPVGKPDDGNPDK